MVRLGSRKETHSEHKQEVGQNTAEKRSLDQTQLICPEVSVSAFVQRGLYSL
jgi:hypothetical protein